MENTYNFYNLEASFKEYLLAGNSKPVSVKNYLSDLRHFVGWVTFYLQSNQLLNQKFNPSSKESIELLLTEANIHEYKNYLIENNIPHKTINRRLSTVRKFFSFCISQGWLKENLAKRVGNVLPGFNTELIEFQKDLQKKGFSNNAITNSLKDIQEFLIL